VRPKYEAVGTTCLFLSNRIATPPPKRNPPMQGAKRYFSTVFPPEKGAMF